VTLKAIASVAALAALVSACSSAPGPDSTASSKDEIIGLNCGKKFQVLETTDETLGGKLVSYCDTIVDDPSPGPYPEYASASCATTGSVAVPEALRLKHCTSGAAVSNIWRCMYGNVEFFLCPIGTVAPADAAATDPDSGLSLTESFYAFPPRARFQNGCFGNTTDDTYIFMAHWKIYNGCAPQACPNSGCSAGGVSGYLPGG
jgi:hypothetical protein